MRSIEMSSGSFFTIAGHRFDYLNPHPDQISIEDIATSLSLQCRFNGHVNKFYSVAEHCTRVSALVPEEDALWGLLHDATEAYVGDVISPLKKLLPTYGLIEELVMNTIALKFNLGSECPESVHQADAIMCATEARDLCETRFFHQGKSADVLEDTIIPWHPSWAREIFLNRFRILTGGTK